jgi:hypothetical protein
MTNNFDFDHIRLSDVDDSRAPLEQDVYTLEVNKLDPITRTINKEGSEFQGQTVPVLQGSFTVVDHDKYASRKVWGDLWLCFKAGVVGAKKIQQATGVQQADGQSISDWASQFAALNPPARIQVLVEKLGPEAAKPNRINFYTVKPVA